MNGNSKENDFSASGQHVTRPVLFADSKLLQDYGAVLRRLLVGFVGSGYGSGLVGPDKGSELVLCPAVEHIEYPVLKLPIFRQKNFQLLRNHLERFKPTVLHSFWPGQPELAAKLSKELQIPFVLTIHKHLSGKLLSFLSIRHAHALIAPTQRIADSIVHVWPNYHNRIQLVPMSCYVEDTCCCYSDSNQITSILTSHPMKHLDEFEPLLQAIRHLALDGFEFLFGIMGSGKAERAIRGRIRALGLTQRVTVVPPMRPIREVLSGADIFIHVRDHGRCNPALLEAMSVGMAMAGDLDNSGELLQNQETALIFDPTDELDIYATLKKLLSRKEEARQLAMRGQSYLRKHHSVSQMVDKLISIYKFVQQQSESTVVNEPEKMSV